MNISKDTNVLMSILEMAKGFQNEIAEMKETMRKNHQNEIRQIEQNFQMEKQLIEESHQHVCNAYKIDINQKSEENKNLKNNIAEKNKKNDSLERSIDEKKSFNRWFTRRS